MITVEEDIFGIAIDPLTEMASVVRRYTIKNSNDLSVAILQLGAIIQSVKFPDAFHKVEDVCLGFDDVAGYVANRELLFGCVLGRVADRIKNAEFIVKEHKVQVSRNLNAKHQLNGGYIGFDQIMWQLHRVLPDGITLKHRSKAGHEGYPGNLMIFLTYTLDENNRLLMRFEATTDATTPVNIATHTYFNLSGNSTGPATLNEHRAVINAEHMIEMDDDQMPTGKFLKVHGTINDVRVPVFLGDRLRQFQHREEDGFNVCFALNKNFDESRPRFAARIVYPPTGRMIEVWTNQPGLYLGTANEFPDPTRGGQPIMGKNCTRYWQHSAFSVQLEKFPDSVNQLDFPTPFITPGEKYFHETIFQFGVQQTWDCCADVRDLEDMTVSMEGLV